MADTRPDAAVVEETFQRAFKLHGEGDHKAARDLYEDIVAKLPGHPGAMQMLASLAYYRGEVTAGERQRDAAITNYRKAIESVPPQHLPTIMNLRSGLVNLLLAADRIEEAETEAKRLQMPLRPMFADPQTFGRLRQQAVAKKRPRIVLNTIPKCASETVWNRLARGLGMAQCHVSLGLFPNCMAVPGRIREFAKGGIITKEHFAPTAFNVRALTSAGIDRMVVQLRDPRQITLSWAHFVRDDISRTPLGPLWRQTCPPTACLEGDLEALLDWCVDVYLPQVVAFMQGWRRINADPNVPLSVLFTTFEDLMSDSDGHLDRVLQFYDLPPETLDREAKAQDGHFRKGKTDEWRSVLTTAQIERANANIPDDLLTAFGWQR